ncbi:MAG: pyrrolo-quinoline quinone repeat-containing [Planctomycetota bacterium]|nr:MAG: pyrrolo-quinoline quinone repeat-containing [Planctomycetota bacterium]
MGGFRGDLSTLGLADIFQTLSNSQKEGTLVVGDGESRKCIYFGKEGLSLLSLGSRKGLRIGDLLLKAGKISPDQLKELLGAQKGSGKKLGELVVERGIATDEEVSGVIRTQIEDEIFDLFSWKKASFEFIDGPPSAEVMDADKPVTSLKFDVNSLLFEASRRIDEWTLIHQAIPSASCIFALTPSGQQLAQTATDQALKTIAHLTDASRTVDQIVDDSGLSRFAACKGLYELLTKKGVRQVSQDELVAMGKKLASQNQRDRSIRILTCAVDLNPENLVPQQELALVLRQAGLNEEAFVYYAEMGRIWESRGRLQEALQCFRQASECRPTDSQVSYAIFKILTALKSSGEAVKIGEQIFPALSASGDRQGARAVGEALVLWKPADVDIRLRVAALCQDLGDTESCGRHLAAAIDHLPPGSSDIDALARKVLAVLPTRTDIRFKIERMYSERRAARKKQIARMATAGGGAFVLLVILMFAWYEIQARRAWSDIQTEADAFLVERKWDQAREKFKEIKSRFPWSLIAGEAAGKISELDRLRAAMEEQSRRDAAEQRTKEMEAEKEQNRRMDEAQKLAEGPAPDMPKALVLYQGVLAWAKEHKNSSLLDKAGAAVKRLEEILQKGAELQKEVDELLKTGNVELAHTRVRELVQKAPKSPQALAARLPYEIRSVPAGAEIFVGGKSLGLTSCVVQVAADAPVKVTLRLRTFVDLPLTLTPGTWLATAEMSKERLWRNLLGGAVETTPCVEGQQVVVGAMDRQVYAIDISNPNASPWPPFAAGSAGQIQSSPVVRDGRIFFGANDNNVYCLDEKSGRQFYKVTTGGPVKGTPSLTPDAGLVLIGSNDGKLWAIQTTGGAVAWTAPAGGKPVRSRALCTKDRAIFGGDDGKIRAVDLKDGKEKWVYTANGPVVGVLATWNNRVVAGSEDGALHVLSLDGQPEWKYVSGKKIEGGACISGDVAYFGASSSLFAVDLVKHQEAWESPFLSTKDKVIRGTPVVGDETVYFGAEDGFLYAVDQKTGDLRWKHATDGPIFGSPAFAQDAAGRALIIVGSSDKYVYALER